MADVKEFRKKPVVIQAIQWDGTLSGMDEILSVFTDIRTVAKTSHPPTNTCSFWKIGTLEGSHEVSAHDFVIRGVKGEYYPCKPDIFFMTYEPAIATPPADAALADALDEDADALQMMAITAIPTRIRNAAAALRARSVHAETAALADDALCESLIEASDMRWNGDVYVGDGADLMNLVRAALRARAVPDCASALAVLSDAMEQDSDYAWTWHCNIAMTAQDAGATHDRANRWAADFMKRAFNVNTMPQVNALLAASKAGEGK